MLLFYYHFVILNGWYSTKKGGGLWKNIYLAFIELLSSFFGTGPVLTGGHMALQCAVPRKSLVTIRTFVRFFTYRETEEFQFDV